MTARPPAKPSIGAAVGGLLSAIITSAGMVSCAICGTSRPRADMRPFEPAGQPATGHYACLDRDACNAARKAWVNQP